MSDTIILILELIGTIAFAISGAMIGIEKKMDIFGVVILGITTAVGGGAIRDIVLGATPPAMFKYPIYTVVAVIASIIVFFPSVRKLFKYKRSLYDFTILLMDTIGLGIFSTVGVKTAIALGESNNFLLIFVGVVTGIGGGVLRDIFAGNTPYIFVKHFYATASLIGTIVTVFLWNYIGEPFALAAGITIIVVLRLLAAKFHWSLPKAD